MHAFALMCSGEEAEIFEGLTVDEDIKTELVSYIKRRLAPQPVKIRSDIEVTCFTYEGIDAIKEALSEGEAVGTPEAPVKIKLIAPPMYVMTCVTLDKDLGIERLNQAIETINRVIRSKE
jgi:translation initiation factor 2 subunit 1